MPALKLGPDDLAAMRLGCLLYLADHDDVDAIRHGIISITLTGEQQAKLRHLVGA